MTPFRIEVERRSTSYFSWWHQPEPLLEFTATDDFGVVSTTCSYDGSAIREPC